MSDLNPYEEGLELELKAAQERLLAACHELARFAEINTKVSDKANTLLIDGARLEDRAEKAEAERDALEAKLAKALEAAFTEGFLAGTEDGWMNNPRIKVEWKHSRSRATLRELTGGKDE
jgi:hypothetical protein